ncbi:hypothetical protein [Pseudomonas nitroreducens]|uniref:hypothetical protein n=1 Tax=Pseudomonas nitroreducens TaxID=46680 RepID=UPI003CC81B64
MADKIALKNFQDLLLDPENPRLPESLPRDQQSMLDYIATTTSIEDLMGAIAENDYFAGEPLIVVPNPSDPSRFFVVEGNRRLTAIILLHTPDRASKPSQRSKDISQNANHKPTTIPVVLKNNRSEILPYLGFRHITGVKPWEPLAKARYIKQLFDLTDTATDPKQRYFEVGRAIGSRSDHIKRNLDALAVYEQIKNENFYDIPDLNEESIKFSILSTALADERIGRFVGASMRGEDDDAEAQHPIVNSDCLIPENIQQLTEWLYRQDNKGRTKVGESRNLRELASVIDNGRALQAFQNGASLKTAYQFTADLIQDFLELIYTADTAITEAAGMVANVSFDNDALEVSRRIFQNIKLIGKTLTEKKNPDDDAF